MNIDTFRRQQNAHNLRASDLRETQASNSIVNGRFTVNSSGEAEADILFPVSFSQQPLITFGWEMQEMIISGHAPSLSISVVDWNVFDRPPFSRFYKGAKILVVSSGPPSSKFIVTWSASGMAFTSPSV